MKRFFLILILIAIFSGFIKAQEEARLLRFPAVYGNQVVFTYAGDLYTVSRDGGIARKLTNGIGYEMFARFSPDGKQIAFTGQYDGNTEVYVMPAEGGVPTRLTYTATLSRDDISDRMGPNNIVLTWTPDGKNVIYRSRRESFNDFIGQLFSVPAGGGLGSEIPLSTGGFCTYSQDGSKLAFNRIFREFRTWKYYRGGMADMIRIYDFKTGEVSKIADTLVQEIFPMWYKDEIYFLSDRDRTMNLFVYNLKTKETKKITNHTDYDIKFPSLGDDAIVYEYGGFIYIYDLAKQKESKVTVRIADDFNSGRNEMKDASKFITNVDVSPDGKRAVFSARGDVFTLPAENGITRNLTQTSGVHEREATWSPDGKYIAYLSDKTGEYEIYIQSQDGNSEPQQVTTGADTYKFTVRWSPDSKKILWNDKMMRLQFVDIDSKKVTEIDKSPIWEFDEFAWSPDSKWVVYAAPQLNYFMELMLFDTETGKKFPVTDNWYSSSGAVFSNDGKYLVFTSERDFNPTYSETEWNYAYQNMSKIYLIMLSADTPSPFAPENDEVAVTKEEVKKAEMAKEEDKKGKKDEQKKETVKPVKIDETGIMDRIVSLPVRASNYYNLACIDSKVYYNEKLSGGDGMYLRMYDLKKKEETELAKGMMFAVSANGKMMLLAQGDKYAIIDLPSIKINVTKFIDLSNMKVMVNNKEEWNQIYNEAWRQMRDFFYVSNMHGLDWKAIHDKYALLVPYVNNRNDLNYILGEMIGELSIGHTYVNGGDKPAPERIKTGLLGARLSRDASGYYKIDKILQGQNWDKSLRSPLTELGVNVKEGDYIIEVNGKSSKDMNDIYSSLVGKADQQVELKVNAKPDPEGSRDVIVIPVDNEADLYYYDWVEHNIKYVNDKTNGDVGYIHIPDMGVAGLNEFAKHFYPQISKKALIIDDRGNGGGNVSPMIIERLRRQITEANMARNAQIPGHTPTEMMPGPMVLLINQYSASDGDLFPFAFRKHNLGKLIGMRTWGGVVGIRGSLPFVDGADLRKPEFAPYSEVTGQWIIEGHGVDPDIMVDNDPAQEFKGIDTQLDKAIEVITQELKNYKPLPPIPQPPDKSK
jgi:tricorn protease